MKALTTEKPWESPHIDLHYNPPEKIGEVYMAGEYPPNAPVCPKCGRSDAVRVQQPAVVTDDDVWRPTDYVCVRCNNPFVIGKRAQR